MGNPVEFKALVYLPNLFSSLRIFIGAHDIWEIVEPCSNPSAERIELGFGPFNAGVSV